MCWLSRFFKPLSLPYPEEPPNYSQTLENISISNILTAWLENYKVPEEYRDYWRAEGVNITVATDLPEGAAAGTWEENGKRYMKVRPEYLNPGVVAHEKSHDSYALLTNEQRVSFSSIYTPLKGSDSLIKLLYSKNTYGLTNDIEGHAEIYRYLGDKMPSALKTFYPKLF